MMSHEIGTIKELLQRLFVLPAVTTTKGDSAVEEQRAEQQAAKTTMHEKVASGRRTNSQLIL